MKKSMTRGRTEEKSQIAYRDESELLHDRESELAHGQSPSFDPILWEDILCPLLVQWGRADGGYEQTLQSYFQE